MKLKKIIAGICAAAISVSALTIAVSAKSSFNEKIGETPVSGNITVSIRQAVAMASIGDNPDNYDIAKVQIDMTYIVKNNIDNYEQIKHSNTKWSTGGNGCGGVAADGYSVVSAKAENNFNINGNLRTYYTDA